MSLTHSITINDVTTTITFPRGLNIDNQLDWSITLTSGINTVSTSGTVDIVVPTIIPAVIPALAVFPEEEKSKHIAVINVLLDMCETLKGKESKAVAAIKILNYISGDALEFTKAYSRFKCTVINKCYEFKRDNSDIPQLVEKANIVLTMLGSPITIPTPANTNIQHVVSVPPTEKKDVSYNPDMALFLDLAKKHNCKMAINNPCAHFLYYEYAVKHNTVKGDTKAEKMESYYSLWSAREDLMRSLFTKNNLDFNDSVMTMYNEWQKTYTPTDKTNRYKKMCAFINAHTTLFT